MLACPLWQLTKKFAGKGMCGLQYEQEEGLFMNSIKNKKLCVVLLLVLLWSISFPAMAAVTDAQLEQAIEKSASYVLGVTPEPQIAVIGGEWAVLGLTRSEYAVSQAYQDNYYQTVAAYVKEKKGILHTKKYTEYSRVILALSAIGADPANVGGYNLLTPLGDFDKTVQQGINGAIWALIALDSKEYAMPVNASAKKQASRQMYVDYILSRQLDNGGWNLTAAGGAGQAGADITGMVLQALAPYQDQPKVKAATEKALACLSQLQKADGGYGDSSESAVQVIVGLSALGIDLEDTRFVKQGNSLLDFLLTYRQADGSFLHTKHGQGNSRMATEQGLYGMTAALRAMEGKSSLYDMTDNAKANAATGQREEKPDNKQMLAALSQPALQVGLWYGTAGLSGRLFV